MKRDNKGLLDRAPGAALRLWLCTSFAAIAALTPSLAHAHGNAVMVTMLLAVFAVLPLVIIEGLLTAFMTRDKVRRLALVLLPAVAIGMLVLVTFLIAATDSEVVMVTLAFLTTAAVGAPLTIGLWRSSRRRAALLNIAFSVLLLPLGLLVARGLGYGG